MVKAKLSGKHLAYQNWWDGNFGHFLDTYKYIVRLSRRVPPSKKKKSLYLVNLEILACLIEHVACLDLMNLYS